MTPTALVFFCATVVAWWAGTGVVMLTGRLTGRSARHVVAGASTLMLGASLAVVAGLPEMATPWTVGVEFLCALAIWGWVETTLYTGVLIGPPQPPLRPGADDWTRFRHAFRANLYHEVAIVAAVVATIVAAAASGAAFVPWAVAILAAMHESARLNVLLGVRNLSTELLPDHLAHFRVYFGTRPSNRLFPVVVVAHVLGLGWLALTAVGAAEPAQATGFGLLAGLVVLGLLEHAALMLPFRPEVLWGWAMRGASPG